MKRDTFEYLCLTFQIQNANDVLIAPLEKFRKEQIGAAKVRNRFLFILYLLDVHSVLIVRLQTF